MNKSSFGFSQEDMKQVELKPVDKNFDEHPALLIDNLIERMRPKVTVDYETLSADDKWYVDHKFQQFEKVKSQIERGLMDQKNFNYHPVQDYFVQWKFEKIRNKFSTAELISLYFSHFLYSYDNDIKAWYENESPHVWLANKIMLSSWHWHGKAGWNTIVDAYNLMSTFSFGEDFEVFLDTSTHYNNKGYSKCTRTFLDAELAFIITHREEHVLTIGFNVVEGYSDKKRRFQVRQIQCKKRTGNRWMFKLKTDLTSYVMRRIASHFGEKFDVQLIKGDTIVTEIRTQYEKNYNQALERLEEAKRRCEREDYPDKEYATDSLKYAQERYEEMKASLDRFNAIDAERMLSIYDCKLEGIKKGKSKDKSYYNIKTAA